MKFFQSVYTDIGTHRKSNQDSAGLFKASTDRGEILFALVCDGMGGYENGELASKVLIEAFENWFKCEYPYCVYDPDFTYENLFEQWGQIIYDCNEKLVKFGMDHGNSLGSTLTAVLLAENEYFMAHVGDSRAFVVTPDQVFQLTRDQSVVAEAVRRGEITPEEAKTDRRRNMLLECIGVTPDIHPLFYTGRYREKDTFLLCSDGFWHHLEDEELIRYLNGRQFNEDLELYMRLKYLIELDKERGEKDNLTAVAIVPCRERTDPVNTVDEVPHVRIDPEEDDKIPHVQSAWPAAGMDPEDTETADLYVSANLPACDAGAGNESTKRISGRFYIMLEQKEVRETADCSVLC